MTDREKLTKWQMDELECLMLFNDATEKPAAVHVSQWDGNSNYRVLCEAGLVKRYARPPKGWSSKSFFGVKITGAGRALIEQEGGE